MSENLTLFKLEGELGYNVRDPKGCSVNNIKVRRNTKLSDKYLVGGSTYVASYIRVSKRLQKLFLERHANYFTDADIEPHFIVFGFLHSRSPLLEWTLQCDFHGFLGTKEQRSRHPELLDVEEDLCEKISCDRSNKYSLLPLDSCAFVFKIIHICSPPKKLSWCEPRIKDGKNCGRYEGSNLRKLGLISFKGKKNGYNLLEMQTIRFRLAKFGVKDTYGGNKLSELDNDTLKNVLSYTRVKSGKRYKQSFPGYSFYGNRILESARYFSRSDLHCTILNNFLPTFGQYLRDDIDTLQKLSNCFKDKDENIDEIFYGDFDCCFEKVARQEQVRDTLNHWKMFRSDLEERLDGWEKRFKDWMYYYDQKSKYGSTAFKMDVSRSVCSMKTVNDHCFFKNDWNIMEKFLEFAKVDSFVEDVSLCKEDIFLFPNKGIVRYSEMMVDSEYMQKKFLFDVPHKVYVETLDRCDYQKYLDTILKSMTGKSCIILYGMEYWKIDQICYLYWNLDAKRIKMHYIGGDFDSISGTSKAKYGLTPLYETLCNYFGKDIGCKSSVLQCPDREAEFANVSDLMKYMEKHQSKISKLKKVNYDNGYQIVYYRKVDLNSALDMVDRKTLLGVSDFDERNFYIGDRVITKCGLIASICYIQENGRSVTRVNRELYTGCFITLEKSHNLSLLDDHIKYHPTELKLAYVLSHGDILFPVPHVVLVGTMPDYVRVQYENFLCTKELLFHPNYKSQNDELSHEMDKECNLSINRLNALPFVIESIGKKRQNKELFDDDSSDSEIDL